MLSYFEKVLATVETAGDGSYVDGIWEPDYKAAANIYIIAPQPLKANELQMLTEGERTSNHLKTWISEEILPRQDLKDSSKINYAGRVFLVVQTNDWFIDGTYYRVVMREITADESNNRI